MAIAMKDGVMQLLVYDRHPRPQQRRSSITTCVLLGSLTVFCNPTLRSIAARPGSTSVHKGFKNAVLVLAPPTRFAGRQVFLNVSPSLEAP